jgi:hypothetical protein
MATDVDTVVKPVWNIHRKLSFRGLFLFKPNIPHFLLSVLRSLLKMTFIMKPAPFFAPVQVAKVNNAAAIRKRFHFSLLKDSRKNTENISKAELSSKLRQ